LKINITYYIVARGYHLNSISALTGLRLDTVSNVSLRNVNYCFTPRVEYEIASIKIRVVICKLFSAIFNVLSHSRESILNRREGSR